MNIIGSLGTESSPYMSHSMHPVKVVCPHLTCRHCAPWMNEGSKKFLCWWQIWLIESSPNLVGVGISCKPVCPNITPSCTRVTDIKIQVCIIVNEIMWLFVTMKRLAVLTASLQLSTLPNFNTKSVHSASHFTMILLETQQWNSIICCMP